MVSRLLYILLTFLTLLSSSFATTTITFESDYGIKNILLVVFLVILFIFWVFIYRFTEELKFDRNNLLKSITNFGVKFLCWIWFIALFYMFQGVLFISSADDFLTNKLDLVYSLFYFTLIIGGILGLFNSVKLYNKMTGTTEFMREFVYEIKTGGKK